MTELSRDDVLKLARLSRLRLTDQEVEQFKEEIGAILQYVEQLQSVDLQDVQPTYQVTGLKNVMRTDNVKAYQASSEDLLQNAPAIEDGHLKVRRMIER